MLLGIFIIFNVMDASFIKEHLDNRDYIIYDMRFVNVEHRGTNQFMGPRQNI